MSDDVRIDVIDNGRRILLRGVQFCLQECLERAAFQQMSRTRRTSGLLKAA